MEESEKKRKGEREDSEEKIIIIFLFSDIDHRRQSTEEFAHSFFCNLFSTLLVIPVSIT